MRLAGKSVYPVKEKKVLAIDKTVVTVCSSSRLVQESKHRLYMPIIMPGGVSGVDFLVGRRFSMLIIRLHDAGRL